MHLVELDSKYKKLHQEGYSDVTWEIIGLLALGKNVMIDGQDCSKVLEVEWACDYFSEFIKTKEHLKADILVATPIQLQAYIEAEQRFLFKKGYEIVNGVVHVDTALDDEIQKKKRYELLCIRKLCSRIFSYDRFLSGEKLQCVNSKSYEYGVVENDPPWGGKQFFEKLGTEYCLYCNFGDVFWTPISRQKNGKKSVSELHTAFDHYFKKSDCPYLGMSLYNLIVACDTCNSHLKTQAVLSVRKHSHPYANDFHALMRFETNFKKLRDFESIGETIPLVLNTRGLASEEILAKNLANDIGILSIYLSRAKYDVLHVVRAMDQRLSDIANYKVKRKDQAWYASKNVADFNFNLDASEINHHRFGKLFIDLVEEYEQ